MSEAARDPGGRIATEQRGSIFLLGFDRVEKRPAVVTGR